MINYFFLLKFSKKFHIVKVVSVLGIRMEKSSKIKIGTNKTLRIGPLVLGISLHYFHETLGLIFIPLNIFI